MTYISFLSILLSVQSAAGQEWSDSTAYEVFDQLIGLENTALYNGPHFEDENIYAYDDSHIYLDTPKFVLGSLVYSGQQYDQVWLKYDLFEDFLITRSEDHLSLFKVRLRPQAIEKFRLHDRHFVRLTGVDYDLAGNGFFEVAWQEGEDVLYIKHTKIKKRRTIDRVLQYYFLSDNYYIFSHQGGHHMITSPNDLKEVFPQQVNAIKKYRKENKDLYKQDRDRFMEGLVETLVAQKTIPSP